MNILELTILLLFFSNNGKCASNLYHCVMAKIGINANVLRFPLQGIGRCMYEYLQHWQVFYPQHKFILYTNSWKVYHQRELKKFEIILSLPFNFTHQLAHYYWKKSLPQTLRRHGIDFFFSANQFLPYNSDIPCIGMVHDVNFLYEPNWLQKKDFVNFKNATFAATSNAQKIITVSSFSKMEMEHYLTLDSSKVVVIPNGADHLPPPNPEPPFSFPYFISIAGHHPRKNLLRVIAAFHQFSKMDSTGVRLVLVGKGLTSNKEINQALLEYQMLNLVHRVSIKHDQELSNAIHHSEGLIYCPLYEGFGLPIAEALSCGTRVVASNLPVFDEYFNGHYIKVDPYNISDMAAALKRCIELGGRPRQKIPLRLYKWKETAGQVMDLIQQYL